MKNIEIVKWCIKNHKKISTAESCTGGLIASSIVAVADASKILEEAFVTYSEEAKMKYLDVQETTLKHFSVVSYETAYEMVIGLQKRTNADICVVTTGIAGPKGGTKKKPVGLVWFGFMVDSKIVVESQVFSELDRNGVREKATEYAFDRLLELVGKSHE